MNTHKEAAAPIRLRGAAKQNIKPVQFSDSSRSAQCERLLEGLTRGSLTTLDIRQGLDILHVGGRVHDLRKRGFHIVTTWVYQPTDNGRFHRVGLYALMPRRRGGRHAR